MKIAAIYTGTSPRLMESVNSHLTNLMPNADIIMFADPTILSDVINEGRIGNVPTRKLYNLYLSAVNAGADIIYNICSSVGSLADTAKDTFAAMGVPIVRIDEDMAMTAVAKSEKIAIIATLSSTLEPTKDLFKRLAHEQDKQIEIVEVIAKGGYGLSTEQMNALLVKNALKVAADVDAIVLAQASMAVCEKEIEIVCKIPVYSSPRFGAIKVKEVSEILEKQK